MLFHTFLWCVLCQERCQKIAPSISNNSLCRSWHGGGDEIPREQIQRSEQFVPPKWHHRGGIERPDRGVLSENNTHIGKVNISHLWWYDRVLTPDFEEGAVCVRSYWSRVSTIQPKPSVLSSYKPHQSSYLILTSRLSAHVTTFFGALSDILGTKT